MLGWAKRAYGAEPVEIELWVNGTLRATQVASGLRKDIKDKKMHPTGECGFDFKLGPVFKLALVDFSLID